MSALLEEAISVLDSFARVQFDRFHEITRVFCSLGFYLQNTTLLDESNKITTLRINIVFFYPKFTACLLFRKLDQLPHFP